MPGPNQVVLELIFGINGYAHDLQQGSWSEPEYGFTWSLTPSCSLSIPFLDMDGYPIVLIDINPATSPPDREDRLLRVFCRGVFQFEVRLGERTVLAIPIRYHRDKEPTEIEFEFDEPVSIQGETRPLAFAFERLWIISQPDPATFSQMQERSLVGRQGVKPSNISAGIAALPLNKFVTRFESLGHSCDFGLFQRDCGAEPLGLLRFSGIPTFCLVHGIMDRFRNLAKPGSIEAVIEPTMRLEYDLVEMHYLLLTHSFVPMTDASVEQLVAREMWRLPYLRRRFLHTLDHANKIFVLRRPRRMHLAEALAVATVLRLSGDNKLLWVVEGEPDAIGSVEELTTYFVKGYLDTTVALGSSSKDAWLSVCREAWRIMGENISYDDTNIELTDK